MAKLALVLLAGLIVLCCVAVVAQKDNTEKTLTGSSNVVQDIKQSVEQTADGLDEAIEQVNEAAEEAVAEASQVVEEAAEDMQTGYEMTAQDISDAVSSETE